MYILCCKINNTTLYLQKFNGMRDKVWTFKMSKAKRMRRGIAEMISRNLRYETKVVEE